MIKKIIKMLKLKPVQRKPNKSTNPVKVKIMFKTIVKELCLIYFYLFFGGKVLKFTNYPETEDLLFRSWEMLKVTLSKNFWSCWCWDEQLCQVCADSGSNDPHWQEINSSHFIPWVAESARHVGDNMFCQDCCVLVTWCKF